MCSFPCNCNVGNVNANNGLFYLNGNNGWSNAYGVRTISRKIIRFPKLCFGQGHILPSIYGAKNYLRMGGLVSHHLI